MSDWIQYDKTGELKWSARGTGRCRIRWVKNVRVPKGSRVWLIASQSVQGKLQYFLYETFVAARVTDGEASGEGTVYGDSLRIDRFRWFKLLLKYMGNFGRGVSPLPAKWATALNNVTKIMNGATPGQAYPLGSPSAREMTVLGDLDERRLAAVRREQGLVRRLLLGGDSKGECVICGNVLPFNLLVAAHIKSRHACTEREKRDCRNNTALMCTLGCDALFEAGFISVLKAKVARGPVEAVEAAVRFAVQKRLGKQCPAYSLLSEPYFSWRRTAHRRHGGRGSRSEQ